MSVTIKPSPHGANEFKPTGASVLTARDLTGLLKDKDKTKDDDKTSAEVEVEVGIKGDGIMQKLLPKHHEQVNHLRNENRFPRRSSEML
jgi:hypothetical protein